MARVWDAERTLRETLQRDAAVVPWNREILIAIGECAFKRTFAIGAGTGIDDFHAGATLFLDRCSTKGIDAFVAHQLQVATLLAGILAITRWYEQGCPIVMLESQKHTAALAGTSLSPSIEMRTPYAATAFQFPGGLFPDMWGVIVHRPELDDDCWGVIVLFQDGRLKKQVMRMPLSDHIRMSASLDDTVAVTFDPLDNEDIARTWRLGVPTDAMMRKTQVAVRITFSACLAVTAHNPSAGHSTSGGVRFRTTNRSPIYRTLSFGRPTQIDCRHAIKDYIDRGSRSRGPLTLQFMVRGFWRNQAYGPRLTLRKQKWIEPFWKGRKDAPVNVRPHTMKGAPR